MQAVSYADDFRTRRINAVAGADAKLHRFLVVVEHTGHSGGLNDRAGNTVGIHGVGVNLVENAARNRTGQPHAQGVAMAFRRQIQKACALHAYAAAGVGRGKSAGDVGVYAGSAEIFANPRTCLVGSAPIIRNRAFGNSS